MTSTFFFCQHVDFSLELGVRRNRSALGQHHAALHVFLRRAAQQETGVIACQTSSSCFLNISTPVTTVLRVSRKPTISTSSPTFTLPRSIRPVTTVPRPEIEKMSSIGIRNG